MKKILFIKNNIIRIKIINYYRLKKLRKKVFHLNHRQFSMIERKNKTKKELDHLDLLKILNNIYNQKYKKIFLLNLMKKIL